ncbi:kelch-like protein 35 isoform X2 [Tubulanus polymorphus]
MSDNNSDTSSQLSLPFGHLYNRHRPAQPLAAMATDGDNLQSHRRVLAQANQSVSIVDGDDDRAPDHEYDRHRSTALLNGLFELYDSKEFTDVVLKAGDREFPCHKIVLIVSSPFFRAMFSHDFLESRERVITMAMSEDTLDLVLEYVYGGWCCYTTDNVQDLLSAANLLQMDGLKRICEDFMVRHVSLGNCVEMFVFAKAHLCVTLATRCWTQICSNFVAISNTTEFAEMPVDLLLETLASDALNVPSEEFVVRAALKWIDHSLDVRRANVYAVFANVRLALLDSYYLHDKIETNALLSDDDRVAPLIASVRTFNMLPNRRHESDLNLMPRRGMQFAHGIITVGMYGSRMPAHTAPSTSRERVQNITLLTLGSNGQLTSHVLGQLPDTVKMPGCALMNNEVYIAGGRTCRSNDSAHQVAPSNTDSRHVYAFNSMTGTITKKKRMKDPRSFFNLVVVDRFMYAIGGINVTTIHNYVEKYDPMSDTWSRVACLPVGLACMAGVSFKGKLYIFGGVAKNTNSFEIGPQVMNTAYCYDPAFDVWTKLPSMKSGRILTAAVVFQDKIYICGGKKSWNENGSDYLKEIEVFDPADESWSFGPELPQPMGATGVVKYNNTLYMISGESGSPGVTGYYYLDNSAADGTSRWKHKPSIRNRADSTMMKRIHCCVSNIPKRLLTSHTTSNH